MTSPGSMIFRRAFCAAELWGGLPKSQWDSSISNRAAAGLFEFGQPLKTLKIPDVCGNVEGKNARARPQPPPGRVERLGPISPCAVRETGGLWNSLARPDQAQNTSAAREKCLRNVGHLSKYCNETIGQICPPLCLRRAESDRELHKTRPPERQLRSPVASSQREYRRSFCAMMVPFVSQEALSKRGRRNGN